MKQAKSQPQSNTNGRASGELRVVAINCNPAPDAQDRLRRLFTILVRLAESDEYSPANPSPEGDPVKRD